MKHLLVALLVALLGCPLGGGGWIIGDGGGGSGGLPVPGHPTPKQISRGPSYSQADIAEPVPCHGCDDITETPAPPENIRQTPGNPGPQPLAPTSPPYTTPRP